MNVVVTEIIDGDSILYVEMDTGRIFRLFVGQEMAASVEEKLSRYVVYFSYLFVADYHIEPDLVKEMDDEEYATFMKMVNIIKAS